MNARKKVTGKAVPFPKGIIIGVMLSLSVTLVVCSVLTWLVLNGLIAETLIGYVSLGTLFLAAVLGAGVSASRIKRRYLFTSVVTGVVFLVMLLLATVFLFGGEYQGVVPSVITVLSGSMGVGVWGTKNAGGRKRRRARIMTC